MRAPTELTSRIWASYALIGANCLVFVLMAVGGVNVAFPSTVELIAWGAEYGPRTLGGEWWRLFSSQFVHIGFLHLLANMIALAYVAPTIERIVGSVKVLLLYLVSGLGGSLLALHFDPLLVHAGASGAIFGLYGALLGLILVYGEQIPIRPANSLLALGVIFVVCNMANSLRPGISLAAHVGGFSTGLVCGLMLATSPSRTSLAARALRGVFAALFGTALLGTGIWAMHAEYPALDKLSALIDHFRVLDNADDATYSQAHEANIPNNIKDRSTQELLHTPVSTLLDTSPTLGDTAFADIIEQRLLPDWRPMTADLQNYAPVPHRYEDDFRAVADYASQRQKEWELLADGLHKADRHEISEGKNLYWQTSGAHRRFRDNALVYPSAK